MKQVFFNQTLKFFKDHKLQNKTVIIAVSGGLDSVVLLDLLKELSKPCKLKLYPVYVHHGSSPLKKIENYRNKAQKFVQRLSKFYNLECICSEPAKKFLKSESDLRDFRHQYLKKVLKQKKAHIIALAHNKNDFLETQLLQLIRGCGEKGLKPLEKYNPPYLRPLLFWTRSEIQKYAKQKKLKFLKDPSNKDNYYLRNWIRNKWLPLLENKRAGSVKSLSRSLESLCPPQTTELYLKAITPTGINRQLLMEMPVREQKRILALYMRKLNLSNYGQSHIEEILKQTERTDRQFSIKILKKIWLFTTDRISVK